MNTVNHQMLVYIVYLFTDINQFFFLVLHMRAI